MPLYEYRCPQCGKVEEATVLRDENPDILIVCDGFKCGWPKMERIPSAPAVHFKGEGWTK